MVDKAGQFNGNSQDCNVSRRQFLSGLAAFGVGTMASKVPIANVLKQDANTPDAGQPEAVKGTRLRKSPPVRPHIEAHVHVNQVGYLPEEPKRAVIAASGQIVGNAFTIVDDDVTPHVRYRGALISYQKAGKTSYGHFQHHFHADFSDFARPGRYRLRLSDGSMSVPFSIRGDVYAHLGPLALGYFDVQRCGRQHSALRGPCHVDDGVVVGGPRDGQRFDASGGWHDAGDYLKFVETTSYVTAVMLFTQETFPHGFPRADRRAGVPPLLAKAKVGLDWLLKMHPTPEEFYYQVGDATDHDAWRLPEADGSVADGTWEPRPVLFGIGANLAGRTAAAFAMASRLYRAHDPAYALRCLAAAQSVYQLGLRNKKVLSTQPADFYPEVTWQDDMEWGAACLFKATGNDEYLHQALEFARQAGPANDQTSVYNTHALAHYTLYPHAPDADRQRLLEALRTDADYVKKHSDNPYGLGTPYIWGTAEAAAGAAINCLLYADLSHDKDYLDFARRQRDFILGCNPFGLSCVIGAGTRYPLFPHHQVANIRNVELSGALVGGPTSHSIFRKQKISLEGAGFLSQNPGPALVPEFADEVGVYHDSVQDYVTNEPANDYTAKFLLMTAFYVTSAKA